MRVLRANEIRALDQAAIQRHGIGSLALMERAGRGCAEAMLRRIDRARRRDMQVFCGKGNNGGDGLVVARYLAEEGCRVKVYLTHPPSQGTPQLRANLEKLPRAVRVVELAGGKELPEFSELLGDDDVVVDALLGVGLQGDLGEPYRGIIASLNEFAGTVVAIDVPSGTGNDNGQVTDPAIRADLTLTIGFPKVGLYLEPATFHAGEIELIPLDYPEEALADLQSDFGILEPAQAGGLLVPRRPGGHKGSYGHLLIIGGSRGMAGSVSLAAGAAYRAGAGSVVIATVASAQPTVAGFQREPMTVALSETPDGVIAPQALRELLPWLEWATTVALGPGLTTKPAARAFVPALLDHWEGPLVLDADGLKIAGAHLDRLAERATPVVCTPHLGEASTLLQIPKEEIQRRRLETVLEAAAQQHLVLLLKGYRPITADPEGRASICVVGNPGLGTAGTGDVLTGIIGALLAQGLGPYDAARVGAYLHGTAGDLAAEARGQISMVAGDVVDHLPGAIQGAIAAH